ncbi:MAG: hypothetical protein H7Y30_09590, partial [Pyrinomonadaceae bacterium]|nr:hypothetical protein [Pyrinomonadaceae bacterium]
YAPVHDPKLAVVVVTRGSGARGRSAAAVAGRIYRALNTRFGTPANMRYAATPEAPKPRTPNAAIVSDEAEADEAAAAGVDPTDESGAAANESSRGAVKSVLLPVPSKSNKTKTGAPPADSTTAAPAPGGAQDAQRPRLVIPARP